MIILKNPKNGAPIQNLWIYDQFYLDEKKGEVFAPNSIMQFEDKIANYLKYLYNFLEEVSIEDAKGYVENQKKSFACTECDYRSDQKIGLIGHMRGHQTQEKVQKGIEGIPIAQGSIGTNEEEIPKEKNLMQAIENEAEKAGLIGEGLVEEKL